jgi:hypothetical protein
MIPKMGRDSQGSTIIYLFSSLNVLFVKYLAYML